MARTLNATGTVDRALAAIQKIANEGMNGDGIILKYGSLLAIGKIVEQCAGYAADDIRDYWLNRVGMS